MRAYLAILNDAGSRVWAAAIAGLIAGLTEAGALVLAVAAAVAMTDSGLEPIDLPFGLAGASTGTLVLLGAGCTVVRTGAALLGLWLASAAKGDVEARHQRALLDAHAGASWEHVASRPIGELQELVGSQSLLAATSVLLAVRALAPALIFLVLVVATVLVAPATAALTIVGAGLLTLVLRPIATAAIRGSRRRSRDDLATAESAAELGRLAEEVAAFGVGEALTERLDPVVERKRRSGVVLDFLAGLSTVAYQGAILVGLFAALGVLLLADVTPGADFGAILLLLLRAFGHSQQVHMNWVGAIATEPRRAVIRQAIDQLVAARPVPGSATLDTLDDCRLVGAGYSYPAGPRALDGIHLTLGRGEAIGITGPSGSGKSTLVQVLLRLRSLTEGEYLVNGRPASDYARESWTAAVALVPQEPKLIDGTIADNVRFLRAHLTEQDLERACRLAGLGPALAAFPEGIDREVGSRHRTLSGGQRQRVAIARALAGSPSLLVLDEPTSALDMECEAIIQETLDSLKGEVTVVVVSHRSSTLQRCDRIVVLRDGRVELDEPAAQAARSV